MAGGAGACEAPPYQRMIQSKNFITFFVCTFLGNMPKRITLRIVYPSGQTRVAVAIDVDNAKRLKQVISQKLNGEFPPEKQKLYLDKNEASDVPDDTPLRNLSLKRGQKIYMRPVEGFISSREALQFQRMIDRPGGTRNYERMLYIEHRMGAKKKTRLTSDEIDRLTFRKIHQTENTYAHGETQCIICLADFVPKECLRISSSCGHVFHDDCFSRWLSDRETCPVCMKSLHDLKATSRKISAVTETAELPAAVKLAARRSGERERTQRKLKAKPAGATGDPSPIPYGGDIAKAISAQDRDAVRQLLRARDGHRR